MKQPDHRQRRIATFMTIGDEEIASAEMLMHGQPRQAAFFQQQAAEKYVRAVLEVENLVAGPTHNLRALIDLLPLNHEMRHSLMLLEDVSTAATRFRYPAGSGLAHGISSDVLADRQKRLIILQKQIIAFVELKEKIR